MFSILSFISSWFEVVNFKLSFHEKRKARLSKKHLKGLQGKLVEKGRRKMSKMGGFKITLNLEINKNQTFRLV